MFLRAGYVNDYGENAGVCRNLEDYFTVGNRGVVKLVIYKARVMALTFENPHQRTWEVIFTQCS